MNFESSLWEYVNGSSCRHTRDVPLWLDKFVEIGLNEGEPLLDAAFDVTAPLTDVAQH